MKMFMLCFVNCLFVVKRSVCRLICLLTTKFIRLPLQENVVFTTNILLSTVLVANLN